MALWLLLDLQSSAAFRRLCVETTGCPYTKSSKRHQPPSGGCVLKQQFARLTLVRDVSAAFRRLCVETQSVLEDISKMMMSAAFRRLCVETKIYDEHAKKEEHQPPSGGCVLKQHL